MPNSVQIELTVPVPTVIASFHVRQIAGDGGSTGPQGPQGEPGEDGLSAYEIWLAAGNSGTEQDFLDSLVGEQGPQGPQGETGPQGATGDTGPQGPAGATGETGPQGPEGPAGATTIEGIAGLQEVLDSKVDESDMFRKVLISNDTYTGSSGIIKMACVFVPAGTFAEGTEILIRSRVRRISGSSSWSNHIYVNTSDISPGATLMGIHNSTSTQNFNQMKRDVVIKSTGTEVFLTTVSFATDDTVTNVGVSTLSIDWSVDQYIFSAVNSGNIADVFNASMLLVEGRKSIE